jgi:hypothetical protein
MEWLIQEGVVQGNNVKNIFSFLLEQCGITQKCQYKKDCYNHTEYFFDMKTQNRRM